MWQLAYCWMATATLLDGFRHTVGWLPPHCWMATATLLDGDRRTLWLTSRTVLNNKEIVPLEFLVCSSNYHFISRMAHTALSANSST